MSGADLAAGMKGGDMEGVRGGEGREGERMGGEGRGWEEGGRQGRGGGRDERRDGTGESRG